MVFRQIQKGRVSAVGAVTRLWAVRPRNRGSIAGGDRRLFSKTSRPAMGPTQPRREGDSLPPSSAEVMNQWN
jgi:hypothetical protein